jgi:hypothetical protein
MFLEYLSLHVIFGPDSETDDWGTYAVEVPLTNPPQVSVSLRIYTEDGEKTSHRNVYKRQPDYMTWHSRSSNVHSHR